MRRALLVGINHYKGAKLDGCINDASKMYEVLSRNDDNSVNFDCKLLTSTTDPKRQITISKLKKEIYNLLHQETEVAIFYFSGHGTTNDIGSYLVTQGREKYQEGVSLSEIITMANSSKAHEVIIILDCCFSGNLANLKQIGKRKALLREGVSILTASRGSQRAVEYKKDKEKEQIGQGLFTSIIYDALKGGAADILGNVHVAGMYNLLDQLLNTWQQRPIFKSHVSKMVSLRKCTPKLRLKTLRKMTKYFPQPEFYFPLDRSYEKDLGSKHKKNIKKMKHLREYYMLGLLEPVGEKYLYNAAENSTSCRLTRLGHYYWKMVKRDNV